VIQDAHTVTSDHYRSSDMWPIELCHSN